MSDREPGRIGNRETPVVLLRAGVGRLGRVRVGTVIIARGEFNIVIAGLAAPVAGRLRRVAP